MAGGSLIDVLAPVASKRPSKRALMAASDWLLKLCSLPVATRNSLPIVVDVFDLLSRNRTVSARLADVVGHWVTRECAQRRFPSRVSLDLLVAYAGVDQRHEVLLNFLAENLCSEFALEGFGEIEVCSLAAAFARLEYMHEACLICILRFVNNRVFGLSWRTYAVILHAFATLRYRPAEENPLRWGGRLSWLKARDYSTILWACGSLQWKVDERIRRRCLKDLSSDNRNISPIDVYSILTSYAYDINMVDLATVIDIAVGKRYTPSAMLSRQLAASILANTGVIMMLKLDALRVVCSVLTTYECDKKESISSGAEGEVRNTLDRLGGIGSIETAKDAMWYSVDIVVNCSSVMMK